MGPVRSDPFPSVIYSQRDNRQHEVSIKPATADAAVTLRRRASTKAPRSVVNVTAAAVVRVVSDDLFRFSDA